MHAVTTQAPPVSAFHSELRHALVAMVRKRVPESEVEDIVQATLTEAIASPNAPRESDALRRWIFGIAKNKVVDFHRRRGRESFDLPDLAGSPAPHQEADLLRWAEKNLPPGEDAQKTLDWMLREGDGEKLESIAESEKLPAPRVRQRVSRLRRHLKTHWQREVALLAALGVVVGILVYWLRERPKPQPIANDPKAIPFDPRAEELRKDGLDLCGKAQWKECIEKLDDAKRLDPAGDTRPEVKRARDDAEKALEPAPVPTTENTTPPPVPLDSASPPPPRRFVDSKSVAPTKAMKQAPNFATKAAPKPTAAPPPVNFKTNDAKDAFTPPPQQQQQAPVKKKSAAPMKPFSTIDGSSGGSF